MVTILTVAVRLSFSVSSPLHRNFLLLSLNAVAFVSVVGVRADLSVSVKTRGGAVGVKPADDVEDVGHRKQLNTKLGRRKKTTQQMYFLKCGCVGREKV